MYEFLTPQSMTQLRRERLAGLEGDHYRVQLQLEEATSPEEFAAIQRDLDEINRRAQVHRAVLNPPVESTADPLPVSANAEPEPATPAD